MTYFKKKNFHRSEEPILKFINTKILSQSLFVHFVTKVSLHFWNQPKILNFLIPYMTYFKKKKFHLSEGTILKFINTKDEKR